LRLETELSLLAYRRAVIFELRLLLLSMRRAAEKALRVGGWCALAQALHYTPRALTAAAARPLPRNCNALCIPRVVATFELASSWRASLASACRSFWKCYHFKK
jgi:hypothetical protein